MRRGNNYLGNLRNLHTTTNHPNDNIVQHRKHEKHVDLSHIDIQCLLGGEVIAAEAQPSSARVLSCTSAPAVNQRGTLATEKQEGGEGEGYEEKHGEGEGEKTENDDASEKRKKSKKHKVEPFSITTATTTTTTTI